MNNSVLQKLLHGHVLLARNKQKFIQDFVAPDHIGFVEGFKDNGIPKDMMQAWMKFNARRIQQSMKFYLPETTQENTLSKEEVVKLSSELEMYLPYKSTFVQHEVYVGVSENAEAHKLWRQIQEKTGGDPKEEDLDTVRRIEKAYVKGDNCIANVYLEDLDDVDDEGMPLFLGNVSTYFKNDGTFFMDPNDYIFSYREDGSYTFWLTEDMPFFEYTDTGSEVDGGMYNNPTLNSMVGIIVNVHSQLVLMLNYPQIVNKQDVTGITAANADKVPFSRTYSSSEFLRKPKYEHKVLKLDLFGANDSGGRGSSGESGSRAFHAVRKHIRQYQDGKITFVKAHFRGSKDVGTITKDYEIVNKT